MSTEVVPPNLALWATGYARTILAARTLGTFPEWDLSTVAVDTKESIEKPPPAAEVIFRDDGGPKTSIVTWSRQLGVSVLAGHRRDESMAMDLALMLMGAFTDESLPVLARPCPIASVDSSNGPYLVTEAQDRSRAYFTVEYTVFGTPAAVAG